MVKTAISKALRVGRATALILGVAVMLALTVGAASTAFGANGKPFLLGKSNVATAVSTLVKKGAGPALSLRVGSGPPLAVNSSAKVAKLNADKLDGRDSGAFLPVNGKAADSDLLDGQDSTAFASTNTNAFVRNNIYKAESAVDAGTALGDGTFVKGQACNPGDVLLSGGPANIAATSVMLESFPTPGSTNSWSVRINKNGQTDNFSVVVLCADQ
jgi:hypothetical protein